MIITDTIARDGYIDLGVYQRERTTIDVAEALAVELGTRASGSVETLTVNAMNTKPKNTYAGNYGSGEIPLHTDLAHWHIPPRYLMLRCEVGDPEVFTLILHHREIVSKLNSTVVDRALFRPRRRLDGRMFLLRLRSNGIFRWDQLFLGAENKEALQAQDAVAGRGYELDATKISLDQPGRTVVIDNWNALHGRSTVKNYPSPRRIERVYLDG